MSRTRFQVSIATPNELFVFDKKQLKKVMRQAGQEVAAAAKALLRASHSGRTYYHDGRRYTASAPGEAPAAVSKDLLRSIKVVPFRSGMGVTVRATEFYALFLEAGAQGGGGKKGARNAYNKRTRQRTSSWRSRAATLVGRRVLLPRPFLSTALDARQASLDARIDGAVTKGIAFKRAK